MQGATGSIQQNLIGPKTSVDQEVKLQRADLLPKAAHVGAVALNRALGHRQIAPDQLQHVG
ncbi:hypothetical protein [Cyanobium sp. HWJ4-Hawea]|uniref:hypothetical protein n=1 Tax=Cyanobium sp. HWJ4-Hawea TaxID=2823713 RepID=UPI0020CE2155|nr:hypothetical protein [Cyanobium sp. HWJ4-Hawea]